MYVNYKKFLVLGMLAVSLLYGTSYQQFRFFDVRNPGGASDALEYKRMSEGDFGVSAVARNRLIVPALAAGLQKMLLPYVRDRNEAVKLSFFVVNFAFMLIAGMAFCYFLEALGFSIFLSILGMGLFYSSRVSILITGTPLVDSYYLAAISVILLLLQTRNYRLLWLLNPVLALSKETIFPFLLLGLLPRENRKFPMFISLIVSFVAVMAFRSYVSTLVPAPVNSEASSLFSVVMQHVAQLGDHTGELFTLRGLYDLQNGFSLLLILAVSGMVVNFRLQLLKLPPWLWLTLPISLVFSLLSGNLGRMFFTSFGLVIPLVLIFLLCIARQWDSKETTLRPGAY